MKVTTHFAVNAVFSDDHMVGVETFCQILSKVGMSYLEKNLENFNTLSPAKVKLNQAKHQELKKMIWEAKSSLEDKTISVSFNIAPNSLLFKKKTKEEVGQYFKKAFKLHWEDEKNLKDNDELGGVAKYLQTTEGFYHQTFKEALANIKIG